MAKKITLFSDKLKDSTIFAVEIVLKENNLKEMNAAILKRKNSSLETILLKAKICSTEELKGIAPTGCPLTLTIGGKGLIHKKVSFLPIDTDSSLLHKVLPNANPKEFYVQKIINKNADAAFCYVSVIRRNVVDSLLEEFKNNKLQIISCSFSPFIVAAIIPLIEEGSKEFFELSFSGNKIIFHSGNINQVSIEEKQPPQSPIQVGDDYIKPELLLAFAAGFYHLTSSVQVISIDIPTVNQNAEEFRQRKIFRLAGWTVLIFYFIVLLINYLMFDSYWEKKNDLTTLVALNQSELDRLELLKKEYSEKQNFLNKAGLLQPSKTSYYADQIVMDMPDQILLTDLSINPVDKKSNVTEDDKYSFISKTIDIKGTCSKSVAVNQWINILKKKSWLSQINLINFNQDKEQDMGIFTIELKVK